MDEKTYYDLLEISPNASEETIRAVYRSLTKKYHPDVYPGDQLFAEEKMKALNNAFAVLSDSGKKQSMIKRFLLSNRPRMTSLHQAMNSSQTEAKHPPPQMQASKSGSEDAFGAS